MRVGMPLESRSMTQFIWTAQRSAVELAFPRDAQVLRAGHTRLCMTVLTPVPSPKAGTDRADHYPAWPWRPRRSSRHARCILAARPEGTDPRTPLGSRRHQTLLPYLLASNS